MPGDYPGGKPLSQVTSDLRSILAQMRHVPQSSSYDHQVVTLTREARMLVKALGTPVDPQAIPALAEALQFAINRRGLDHFQSYERSPDGFKDSLANLISEIIDTLSRSGPGGSVPLLDAFAYAAPRNAVAGEARNFYPLPPYYDCLLRAMASVSECVPGLLQLTSKPTTASAAIDALTGVLTRNPAAVAPDHLSQIANLKGVTARTVPPDPEWGASVESLVELKTLHKLVRAEVDRRETAPAIAERKARRLCYLCGAPLSWWHRQVSGDHHRGCTVFQWTPDDRKQRQ